MPAGEPNQVSKKRCACGLSTVFPLCDGSHSEQGWSCSALSQVPVQIAFLAGPHLTNLADRLAHGLGGISIGQSGGTVQATELVVLSDGSDVQWLRGRIESMDASSIRVLGIGLSDDVLRWAFPEYHTVAVSDENPSALWSMVEAAVRDKSSALTTDDLTRPTVFVSHAIADEGHLFPVLKTLREQYSHL